MLAIVPVLEIPYTPLDTTLSILKYCEPSLNIWPGTIVPEVTDVTYKLLLFVTLSFAVMVWTAVFGLYEVLYVPAPPVSVPELDS
jgi:hypothetical protein